MSVNAQSLLSYLNSLLQPQVFNDYCPNGLQVQGAESISRIIGGVTASLALIEAAIEEQADAILVHHGYFWKGEAAEVVGMKYRRLQRIIKNDINLFAYHLPLDAHALYGNNVQLAKRLQIIVDGPLDPSRPQSVGNIGHLSKPLSAQDFCEQIATTLHRQPQLIVAGDRPIERIAWCTGAADNYIEQAARMGADAYLSGEISEPTVHCARELGVHYIAAGHHATERYGVQALGAHLAQQFDVEFQFIDIENPV